MMYCLVALERGHCILADEAVVCCDNNRGFKIPLIGDGLGWHVYGGLQTPISGCKDDPNLLQ